MVGKCARALNLLVDYMNKTQEVKDFIDGWDSRIRFDLRGEEPFGVVFLKYGGVKFEGRKIENPDVEFFGDSNIFFGMITGKINQDEAFSNGLVEIKGSIFDSVRFRHAAEITQHNHATLFSVLKTFSRLT